MATTDELLASLSESTPEHTHNVSDSDTYFIINPITRQVVNTASTKNVLMQFDHDSERFTFELPRYVENHDMTLCNVVKVHYNNLDSETDVENTGVYDVTDLAVDPENPNNVICSWLISRNATQLIGPLSFIVQYACVIDGELVYEWHSDIYYDIEIKAGRNNGDTAVGQYTDVFEQWRERLFGAADSAMTDIENSLESSLFTLNAAKDAHKDEISAKAEEVLATIPEDYITTHEMADEALRKKANAIILSETGDAIYLDDSSDCNLLGLNLYGKTTQLTTAGTNLFDANNCEGVNSNTSLKISSDTYTIIAKGGSTAGYAFSKFPIDLAKVSGRTIHMSVDSITGTVQSAIMLYGFTGGTISLQYALRPGDTTIECDIPSTTEELKIYIYTNTTGATLSSINTTTIEGLRLTYNNDAWEPYSGGYASPSPAWSQEFNSVENLGVRIYRKNLFNVSNGTYTNNGITFTKNPDGSITLNGTSTSGSATCMIDDNNPIPAVNTPLIASLGNSDGNIRMAVGYHEEDGTIKDTLALAVNKERELEFPSSAATTRTYLHVTNTATYTDYTVYPMLRIAKAASEIDSSSNPKSMILTQSLHGVATSQNGNYTDANGQQWICDEIDFEKGKFIQRVQSLSFDGTESWSLNDYHGKKYILLSLNPAGVTNGEQLDLCTHAVRTAWVSVNNLKGNDFFVNPHVFFSVTQNGVAYTDVASWKAYLAEQNELGNPVTILYALGTPIEHDLTSTELQAFRALKTNATNTTILNDQNARMSVKYVADIEQFIYNNVSGKQTRLELELIEANWVESQDGRYYTQTLNIPFRENVEINMHPTAEQQVSLILDGIAMFVANDHGVATAYAIGGTPGRNITIPATERMVVFE